MTFLLWIYFVVASMMVEIEQDKTAAAQTKSKVEIEEINANEKAADAKVNEILNNQTWLLIQHFMWLII